MSFDECLDSEVITFPIFDLDGKASYGQQEYHRWRTGVWSNLFGLVPLFFYGTQIIASVLFATLEVYKSLMHPMVYTPTLILYPK